MRLKIDTDGTQFRVAGPVRPKQDYKDKERQATTRDGEPIWTVRLDAIEPEREARETIWVEVADPRTCREALREDAAWRPVRGHRAPCAPYTPQRAQ